MEKPDDAEHGKKFEEIFARVGDDSSYGLPYSDFDDSLWCSCFVS